jgi:hypothetical protein
MNSSTVSCIIPKCELLKQVHLSLTDLLSTSLNYEVPQMCDDQVLSTSTLGISGLPKLWSVESGHVLFVISVPSTWYFMDSQFQVWFTEIYNAVNLASYVCNEKQCVKCYNLLQITTNIKIRSRETYGICNYLIS